jgi:hypothetical protein
MDAQDSAAVMLPLLVRHDQDRGDPSQVMVLAGTEYEREVFSGFLEGTLKRNPCQGT